MYPDRPIDFIHHHFPEIRVGSLLLPQQGFERGRPDEDIAITVTTVLTGTPGITRNFEDLGEFFLERRGEVPGHVVFDTGMVCRIARVPGPEVVGRDIMGAGSDAGCHAEHMTERYVVPAVVIGRDVEIVPDPVVQYLVAVLLCHAQ